MGVMLMVFALILTLRAVEVFVRFLGLFSLFRAEMWGVILALQTSRAVHLGVDNLGVVRHVGRQLGGCRGLKPFEFVNDGDLLLLIDRMLRQRGLDTVCISKVKSHADDGMVLHGQVRREDKWCNDAADEAADFGRRRVSPAVIDARRNLSGVCGRWYPVILDLHRFFIAISRAVVSHDGLGGAAPNPLVWSAGAPRKRRRLVHAVCDRAFFAWASWYQVPAAIVSEEDIDLWPYCLFLYELWAGERLSLEKAHPRYLRPGRPISVSAVPFGPGIDIWRSCRFIGAMMRSLCMLLGGLGRVVPCSVGANHCRLRHFGWEKCGHGLTSRPRESASELFLNELLSLFRYPPESGRALLNGTLPLRYCAARFAKSTPTWRLPVSGRVSGLVAAYSDNADDRGDEVVGLRVLRGSGSGPVAVALSTSPDVCPRTVRVVLHCGQDHTQRKLLVAPVHAQPTVTAPRRRFAAPVLSRSAMEPPARVRPRSHLLKLQRKPV